MLEDDQARDIRRAMLWGCRGHCPNCGHGKLFAGYLKVAPRCVVCGEDLGRYRAADGPAFITISIVGLLLIPILGWSYVVLRPNPLVLALIVAASITVLSLVLLRIVKGAFIGYLWSVREMDRGA